MGPNAGEVIQGFGIALRLNATKADFNALVGIHPTTAEVNKLDYSEYISPRLNSVKVLIYLCEAFIQVKDHTVWSSVILKSQVVILSNF